jgi:glucosylceramidase
MLLIAVAVPATFFFLGWGQNTNRNQFPNNPSEGHMVEVWLTKGDRTKLLSKESDLPILNSVTGDWPIIEVDTTVQYQTIDGYGAALTGSSAYLMNRHLSPQARQTLINDLFHPEEGIGISFVRLTMGASDFSLSDFSYNDMPPGSTDFALENFSLSQDLYDVVPVLLEILAVAPDLKLMGSPWSPPAWMKTTGSMIGGKLRRDCYDVYARYFVRYIQEMQELGINIHSVTPQNEPLFFTATYPCMEMQAGDQLVFVRDYLGPHFKAAGLETKIIIYDHNWYVTDYAISILNDELARNFIAGTAFHGYGGHVSAMSEVHAAHPDKELHFTEISGGEWAIEFASNLMWYMQNIFIGTARNWSRSAMMWNLALNEEHGPQNNGCPNCRGVVTINENTGQITFNEEYYAIGHFSKFVRPGARRVGLLIPQGLTNIDAVAFINENGEKVFIAANYGNDFKTFTVRQGGRLFTYTLPGRSVATITW